MSTGDSSHTTVSDIQWLSVRLVDWLVQTGITLLHDNADLGRTLLQTSPPSHANSFRVAGIGAGPVPRATPSGGGRSGYYTMVTQKGVSEGKERKLLQVIVTDYLPLHYLDRLTHRFPKFAIVDGREWGRERYICRHYLR